MKASALLLCGLVLGLGPSCVSGSSPDVSPLIAAGREKLDAGEIDAALELFEQAARQDDHSLQTRMWVLRSWIELGRNNDTLDELDALVDEGHSGPEMDYLFGMAFARRAQDHQQLGVNDSSVKMNFEDAVERLEVAVRADEERFSDAFEPLAQAALYTRELERARRAAKKAIEHYPDYPHAWLTYGRVSLSLFKVEQEVEPWGARAERQWTAAEEAFGKAIAAFGRPISTAADTAARATEAANQASLAQAAIDHGNTLMWKQLRDPAADAYALAATWSPDAVDYVQIREIFDAPDRATGAPGPESSRGKQTEIRTFNRACEGGAKGFVEVFGAGDPRGVTLFWWLGYSRLELGDYAGAEEAFLVTLDKDPGANSWFYLAMARYLRQENEPAIRALAQGWEENPAAILTEMKLDAENHIARLEVLTGWALAEGHLVDCALLSEICAETALKDARHWHNLGIFLRDELARIDAESEALEIEQLTELRQRSLNAHMRAVALAPDDPQILNDAAVVMHYYLEEDLPVALKMYEHAIELAAQQLAEQDLSEAERARIEAARDDAVKNRDTLSDRLDG